MGEDGDLYEIWGVESIELIEFYLESGWNHLECYTGESAQVFQWFLGVLGDFIGEDGDLYEIWGLESIEIVEFYLESRWNHLE